MRVQYKARAVFSGGAAGAFGIIDPNFIADASSRWSTIHHIHLESRAMQIFIRVFVLLVAVMCVSPAWAAAQLSLVNAWIPQAPPGAGAMAGYLTITNTGDAAVDVLAAQSDRFRMVSVHETVVENGVARMRELTRLELAPGKTVEFKPGGMHLMLMQPRSEVMPGEHVEITFLLSDGQRVPAIFDVQAADAGEHAAHEH